MSYYYTYYLGRRETATGKVGLAGPYDKDGRAVSIMSKSRSFASDLHEDMLPLAEEDMAATCAIALPTRAGTGARSLTG